MSSKLSIWAIGALSAVSLCTPAAAAGSLFRPPAFHSGTMHAARAMPPVAGTWHVRPGRTYFTGWGHANTSYRPGTDTASGWHTFPGTGVRVFGPGYGHTSTAWTGGARIWSRPVQVARDGRPFGLWYNRSGLRYGSGYGRRYAYRNWRYASPYAAGGYGGYDNGFPGYGGGYVESSVSSQYGEAPLNLSYFGGPDNAPGAGGDEYGAGSSTPPSIVGMGGPRVLFVNNATAGGRAGCDCARRTTPIVYRFGVGSYY